MGSAVHTLTRSQHLIMKFVLVLLFVGLAFAEPESAPDAKAEADAWYYGYYGHPAYSRWGGYYGGYYGYPYRYGYGYYGRKKRDAEADPAVVATTTAVKAPQVYAHPYAYGFPYVHTVAPVTYTHAVTTPVTYTAPHHAL